MARRALLVFCLAALLPWLYFRATRGLWVCEGLADYLRWVVWEPIEPWTMMNYSWWHESLRWFDWPVVPSFIGMVIVASWKYTAAPLLRFVIGPHQKRARNS